MNLEIDKYDKEFVNLMLEIERRTQNYPKQLKLRINSWARVLCLPTNNLPFKKNRNLYAIILLDNIVNNKLEEPFNKVADESKDLPVLNPTLIKSQISQKFLNEITFENSEENIKNFVNFLSEHLNLDDNDDYYENEDENYYSDNYNNNYYNDKFNNKFYQQNNFNKNKNQTHQNFYNNKYNLNKNNYYQQNDDYYNNNNNYYNINNNYYNNNIKKNINKYKNSNELLEKNFIGLKQKLKNEPGFFLNNKLNTFKLEKAKLESTINLLKNELSLKTEIMKQQKKDINLLKRKVLLLEKKVNYIYGYYPH